MLKDTRDRVRCEHNDAELAIRELLLSRLITEVRFEEGSLPVNNDYAYGEVKISRIKLVSTRTSEVEWRIQYYEEDGTCRIVTDDQMGLTYILLGAVCNVLGIPVWLIPYVKRDGKYYPEYNYVLDVSGLSDEQVVEYLSSDTYDFYKPGEVSAYKISSCFLPELGEFIEKHGREDYTEVAMEDDLDKLPLYDLEGNIIENPQISRE